MPSDYPTRYDVAWDEPGGDATGSVPLGNGEVGANFWIERGGDLVLLIGTTDAWDGNDRLLKIGRVRIALDPNPFREGMPFAQRLRLAVGDVEVRAGDPSVFLRVWIDAHAPVIRVEVDCARPTDVAATVEIWRTERRPLVGRERESAYGLINAPREICDEPDTPVSDATDRVVWFHRNETSVWRESLEHQGLGFLAGELADPLAGRTFGGLLRGDGLRRIGPATLRSQSPATRIAGAIHVHTAQTTSADDWMREIVARADRIDRANVDASRAAHRAWWRSFWDRSRIEVSGADDAETVTRGYVLQRYVNACGGRGRYPVKFNGSIFTADATEDGGEHFSPDYRRWGGPYWFQNTRLIYWPMLAAGDFDLMEPFFRMYRDALPLARARTRAYFAHEGAMFPETMTHWGTYANDNYGWDRAGKHVSHVDNGYIRHYWQGMIELVSIALDYYAFTRDDAFLRETLLPLADPILAFFDVHYPRDSRGKIRFEPAAALETWHAAIDPLPEIAGLRFVIDGLLALPDAMTGDARRGRWTALRAALPDLPARESEAGSVLAPAAELIGPIMNSENPELYAVFPYRLFGVGRPDLDLALRTFELRRVRGWNGWRQDDTQAAFLGLAGDARAMVAERFAARNPRQRFPAFWGPNMDWTPDQTHGGNGLMALQTMLLQWDGQRIILLPAWPRAWDVDFRLHAPERTLVAGTVRNGRLVSFDVEPAARRSDVVFRDPQ